MYILDTNILIYLMKGQFPAAARKLLSLDPSETAVSAITIFELEYGAGKSMWAEKTRRELRLFLSPFPILPFTAEDALIAGSVRAKLAKEGAPIGAYDLLIAAQGLSRGAVVVTHNTKEFERIPGLKLEDWTVESE